MEAIQIYRHAPRSIRLPSYSKPPGSSQNLLFFNAVSVTYLQDKISFRLQLHGIDLPCTVATSSIISKDNITCSSAGNIPKIEHGGSNTDSPCSWLFATSLLYVAFITSTRELNDMGKGIIWTMADRNVIRIFNVFILNCQRRRQIISPLFLSSNSLLYTFTAAILELITPLYLLALSMERIFSALTTIWGAIAGRFLNTNAVGLPTACAPYLLRLAWFRVAGRSVYLFLAHILYDAFLDLFNRFEDVHRYKDGSHLVNSPQSLYLTNGIFALARW